ncbi:MAG: FMN-binding protein [Verrucomicrobiaceae bacterium]|nr:FMN-binding protein [Verrucomicrobiaceae bacterium]
MSHPNLRLTVLRLFRLALLVAAVLLIRARSPSSHVEPLTPERVRDFFPAAALLESTGDVQVVKDAAGVTLGTVAQTSPASDAIIGYSGPTNTLVAFDAQGAIVGLRVLGSGDTPEHVAEVIGDRAFFKQFHGLKPGAPAGKVDAVSGATLTSEAMAEGVLQRLGHGAASLRFPEPVTLDEVRALEPKAASLRATKRGPGVLDVLDASGARLAVVTRTSPAGDSIAGYQGPTDTLMLLDADGATLRAISVRKSYETKSYLGYVTDDAYFMRLFNGRTLGQLAGIDFEKEKIEGVSGATITSWSVAESLKKRAETILAERAGACAWVKQVRWRWQDTGHALVILSALGMSFTALRGSRSARTVHHLLLVGYCGACVGEMLSQALFVGWARYGLPWRSAPGLVLLAAVALLAPVFSRRQLYCHHICPHGALQQLLMRRVRWRWVPPAALARVLEKVPFALLLLVFITGAAGLALDLNAIEPFDAWLFKIASLPAVVIAGVGIAFSLVTPMAYCRYGCPTGALFKLLRFTGDAERFGVRDGLALAAVTLGAAAGWLW